jgi:hypothetical protein
MNLNVLRGTRKVLATVAIVALAGSALGAGPDVEPKALLDHIKFLASDEMKGRANGSPELERASDYMAQQFRAAGLQPGGKDGSWFQPFELIAGLTVGAGNNLTFHYRDREIPLTLGSGYYPMSSQATNTRTVASSDLAGVPVVFAGYGLAVPAVGYDDYGSVDVKGKVALIFSHEPQEQNAASRLNGTRPMPQTTLRSKAALASKHGAVALMVISDPTHRVDQADYGLFTADPDAEDEGIPVVRVRRADIKSLIDEWGLDGIARLIDQDLVPRSRVLPGATVDYVEHLSRNRRNVRNVIGILPGSDPAMAAEAVVLGAHYDHVGLGGRLSVAPERTGEIHNGADDNASGTSSIMEIARAAAEQRARFPRTLVFIAFAGEERGLLGSAYYAANPSVPLQSTVAMLNLDMVGRSRGGVDVSGLELAPSIEADLKAASAGVRDLEVRRQGPGAGRSDDSSFIDKGIPAINFFTGFHPDYHRPGDDWEKIDAAGTARVAGLALELAARLAARPARPEFIPQRQE